MPEMMSHPSEQALALFGNGKLCESQTATLIALLETCADCRNAVAGLPPDSFMCKVRAAKPSGTQLPPGPSPVRLAAARRQQRGDRRHRPPRPRISRRNWRITRSSASCASWVAAAWASSTSPSTASWRRLSR